MPATGSWDDTHARAIIARHADLEGPLLPMLHALQAEFGHVPGEAVPLLAEALDLSQAEVHGVITFYHDFRHEPPGRHVLKMCRAEACQSMGGEDLVAKAERSLGVACGETSADGRVTLEPVYCLGLCATAPSAMLDGRLVGRLTLGKLETLLKKAGA